MKNRYAKVRISVAVFWEVKMGRNVGIGIPAERIRSYGFAFEGKKVLVG